MLKAITHVVGLRVLVDGQAHLDLMCLPTSWGDMTPCPLKSKRKRLDNG